MRLYHCPGCSNLLFFENSSCLSCGAEVGFDAISQGFHSANGADMRRCMGGAPSCNWLVPQTQIEQSCLACRSTTIRPQTNNTHLSAWDALERAKRRLLQTLLHLGLNPEGLRFSFPETGMTGHADGLITVVLKEADDAERLRMEKELGEPIRTLIGHMRHESGHYFHQLIMLPSPRLDEFRSLFGDERSDYAAALAKHYKEGPRAQWGDSFVSAYASAHPHEDWAETWAHYLHMVDALEIAAAYGVALNPPNSGTENQVQLNGSRPQTFKAMLEAWRPLTWFANSMNRSLGHHDWYPFSISGGVINKLRFIHEIVQATSTNLNQASSQTKDRIQTQTPSKPKAPSQVQAQPQAQVQAQVQAQPKSQT